MCFMFQAIFPCFGGSENSNVDPTSEENAIASDVLQALLTAEKGGEGLKKVVRDRVGEYGWTENLAKAILGGLENALKNGAQMGEAMKNAFDKAVSEATEFAKE